MLASLLSAPPALAEDQEFGYKGSEAMTGTLCEEGQACTPYPYEGAQEAAPVTGWITKFTLHHSTAGGGTQTARLLVVKEPGSKEVVAVSPVETLSESETTQTFAIPEAQQPHIARGEALTVTVTPTAGHKADNVIVKGAGDVAECDTAPTTGQKIEPCLEFGELHMAAGVGVSAYIEDEVRQPEVASYSAATSITATSAELHARIKPDDPEGHTTMARFEYGTVVNNLNQISPEESVASGEAGKEDEVNISLSGVAPSTTYYYRVGVSNYEAATNSGWHYGNELGNSEVKSFTTPAAPPPTVALSAATNVIETTATLNGTVASNGLATSWKFEYGESPGYGASSAGGEVGSGSGGTPQPVSANLAGLKPNTLYHYRLTATNPGGTTQSADGTFRTAAGNPPALASFAFTDLSPWEVVLSFTVDPKGYATTFVVQWGTTTSYGNNDSGGPTSAVLGPQGYTWDADYGLSPGTTYHMRVVATNQWGTTAGPDLTITTPGFTTGLLVEQFGIPPENAVVPVNLSKPILILGKSFACPPACEVEAEVFAVGKHGKKIKLGKAKFKVPKDHRKHKLEVRLPKKAKRLLAKDHRLHLKVRYKIASEKSKQATLVSSLTLTTSKRKHGHGHGHGHKHG